MQKRKKLSRRQKRLNREANFRACAGTKHAKKRHAPSWSDTTNTVRAGRTTRTRVTIDGKDRLVTSYHGCEVPPKVAYSLYNCAGIRRPK